MRDGGPSGERPTTEKAVGSLILVVGVAAAGTVAQNAGLPAPWLVGPMLAALVFALRRPGGRPDLPGWAHRAALGVIGGVLAGAFRPSVLPLSMRKLLTVLAAVLRNRAPWDPALPAPAS